MDQLFKWLRLLDPLYFLFAYLMCVPAFALIYWNLPGGFYAPYAKLESSARTDSDAVAEIVGNTVDRYAQSLIDKRRKVDENYTADGWAISLTQKTTAWLLSNSDENTIRLQLMIFLSSNSETERGVPVEATLFVFRSEKVQSRSFVKLAPHLSSVSEPFGGILRQLIFPTLLVDIATEDIPVLVNYLDGLQGDALSISNSYFRMLYFSVVVITTVGFGDIVPITTAARLWVAVEAILGVVLAGLFINAIANRD
ncbi:potassium channel family protein [Bradyrhizobium sp. F1.13.3]|uniref:potassium channel family protein n=1 Tax=Bradyrhizobium sp. F1.13.3 TaxID=3156351 RepID=UPI003392007E